MKLGQGSIEVIEEPTTEDVEMGLNKPQGWTDQGRKQKSITPK